MPPIDWEASFLNAHVHDIAVIGAGPVGLFMVFEAGFLGYRCAVIDSLPEIGGQLTALYPEKPIYDIPGFPSVLAGELINNLAKQAEPFSPTYYLGHPVSTLTQQDDGSYVVTAGPETIRAKAVVIAGGMGVFTPRKPPLADIAQFEHKSLFYAVRDRTRFKDQTLVIAGGGDSAADWTAELAPTAKHVHLVHRRDTFRAAEATMSKIDSLVAQGKVTIHTNRQMAELVGQEGQVTQVVLADLDSNTNPVPADAVLCFFGLSPALGPIAEWGIDLAGKKIKVTPDTMATNQPGIMAIGDITDYPGKLDLILTGFAEAAIAAKTCQGIINPEKKFKLVYTTSRGLPGQEAASA